MSAEEWKKWAEEYPPREVFVKPDYHSGVMDDYVEAVIVADKLEEAEEVAYDVVLFESRHYIVRKP